MVREIDTKSRISQNQEMQILPSRRRLSIIGALIVGIVLAYMVWSPGKPIADGRFDLEDNAMWLQHGWLGDDRWFELHDRDKTLFRSRERIRALREVLEQHHINHLFPHLCPSSPTGAISKVDSEQTELFLDELGDGISVIPWIGGVLEIHCHPQDKLWRSEFVASVLSMLEAHPRLAGVHVNIEPLPSGNPDFITLLHELRQALPSGKILSVAAYPPPTLWHQYAEVHWDESYYKQVSHVCDHVVVMMYDTALWLQKPYRQLMADWTEDLLNWMPDSQVWLGLPAYDDAGVGYHHPHVENLRNGILGVNRGLSRFTPLPKNYAGIAIYSEWEMEPAEWQTLRNEILKPESASP